MCIKACGFHNKKTTMQTEEMVNRDAKGLFISLLRDGQPIYVNARGGSMYPFVKNGDKLKINPIIEEEIQIGDIIAVNIKNEEGPWFFVHRLVKITESNGKKIYFTKGDAQKGGLDEPVTMDLIEGRVGQILRKNLNIRLELPLWRRLNTVIAKLSFKYPKILHFFSIYISLIIEWRLFLFKIKKHISYCNLVSYKV